jgi:hypothetical protein
MKRNTRESGAALIMLLGIAAALAILAIALVMLLANQQGATAAERNTKTSMYYAEAALNSAVNAVKGTNSWLTTAFSGSSATTAMNSGYSTSLPSGPTVTYKVYDNASPITGSTPAYDANGDGMVWVEVITTYQGRTTRIRELVSSSTTVSILPKAAAYADTDIVLNGTSNIYGVNNDGTPDDGGPPYVTTIMAGSDITTNSSTTIAYPGHSVQSLGLEANGNITTPGHSFNTTPCPPAHVGLLSDYFDMYHQQSLTNEARAGIPTQANASGTAITTTVMNTLQSTNSQTYNAATDLVMPSSLNSGNLTLAPGSGKVSTFNFKSLYVNGNLTISGSATVNTTSLYVGGNLTITGSTAQNITDQFGAIYVAGKISWKGPTGTYGTYRLAIKTTDYTNSSAPPDPMYCKILSVDGNISSDNSAYDGTSGAYDLTLGPVWVDGDAGTGDIAVNFSGPTSATSSNCPTVMCPLLATTERTVSNGYINVGTLAKPMIYYMQCDNDGLYSNTCSWASTGTYYGLMILFEAPIEITGGNDGSHPNIVGAVLEGTPVANDITMTGNSSICYNQTVINNCTSDSLRTTVTNTVPGSWQQLTTP